MTDRSEESDRATDEERMDALLEQGLLRPSHMRALAAALLDRHARTPVAPDAAPEPDFFRGVLDSLDARHALSSAVRDRFEADR